MLSGERPASWWSLLPSALLYFGLWTLLTPLVVWLAKRLSLRRDDWLLKICFHLLIAIGLAVFQQAVLN